MIRGPKKAVTVTISMELYEYLWLLAAEHKRTVTGEIRQILKQHIRQLGLHDDTPF